MADETTDEPVAQPNPCQPCGGTGKVISNLGGSPKTIACPWCEATGKFIAGHDAQEHWISSKADAPATTSEDEEMPANGPVLPDV